MHKVNLKFHQMDVTQKLRKEEQSFLYSTHRLNLIHIAIKLHQDIPYGYLVMACARIVWKEILSERRNSESKKGRESFLHMTCCLGLIYIALKFHSDIPYCYQVKICTSIDCKKLIKGQ